MLNLTGLYSLIKLVRQLEDQCFARNLSWLERLGLYILGGHFEW